MHMYCTTCTPHIAAALQDLDLEKQGHRWKQSATPSLHQATATPLPVAAAAAVNVTSTTLQQYIHHLPPPTPPPAWWRLCNNISSKHLTGLKSGLLPQQMTLPDVQGAAGLACLYCSSVNDTVLMLLVHAALAGTLACALGLSRCGSVKL